MTPGKLRQLSQTARQDRGDAGGHAVELLIIAPAVLLFVLLLVAFGRVASTSSAMDAAAASAARAASQTHDEVTAEEVAMEQVSASIAGAGLNCSGLAVDVDASAFGLPVGVPGSIVVEIACTVSLSDVALPGIPGSVNLSGRAASPVDILRERA